MDYKTFDEMVGKTLTKVEANQEEVIFDTTDGRYALAHQQDCCECVGIREIDGDITNLVGEVLEAKESIGHEPPGFQPSESYTLTDFTIRTEKGTVVFKWLGESNGYYSESVTFYKE